MKNLSIISVISAISLSPLLASTAFKDDLKKNNLAEEVKPKLKPEEALKIHAKSSGNTAAGQDELSADVQDLIQEQTNQKVVELLDDAESLMGEATKLLEEKNTGPTTIAIQTEIIEKIYEAAKQKQGGKGKGSPMMDMMDGMMDQQAEGKDKKEGEGKDKGEGSKGGEGNEGSSDTASKSTSGIANNTKEERRVPKNTSTPSISLPLEEQRALDAYNK